VTSIEWTDETWNPVTGCTKVSAGCKHCYAERLWPRMKTGRPFTEVTCHPDRLEKPLHWRKPRRVFVNSMSDLFHEDVPDEYIDRVFAVMAACSQHTFQILTKRPERMREYLMGDDRDEAIGYAAMVLYETWGDPARGLNRAMTLMHRQGYKPPSVTSHCCPQQPQWPLSNVWLGVSIEDQATADARIPVLLDTPAAVRWVSYEPALGPIMFCGEAALATRCMKGHPFPFLCSDDAHDRRGIDWLIVGGESGPKARPCVIGWIRDVVRQCRDAEVPVFVKQLGANPTNREGKPHPTIHRAGADPSEWPDDLMIREYPSA